MLRYHHHLCGFVKLVLWDVYCVNGYGSFRLGYVGVGFGENCDCRYGIYVGGWFLWVWLFWHLLLILWKFLFLVGVGLPPGFPSGVLLCYKYHHLAIFIVVFWLKFTPPYSLNTQRGDTPQKERQSPNTWMAGYLNCNKSVCFNPYPANVENMVSS